MISDNQKKREREGEKEIKMSFSNYFQITLKIHVSVIVSRN